MRRALIIAALPLFLAACGAESVYAPEEQVQAAVYRDAGPASLTLFTMINNRSGSGAHTGLMINGSQRVIFDPAGSWWHRTAPERNDVHFGMTPTMVEFYIDYHARETYRVERQTVQVSPEVAEMALQLVQAYGAVPKAMCANSTSAILRQLPGFENVPQTWFPNKIRDAFAELPGVQTVVIRQDEDSDDNSGILTAQQQAAR
ncbi:hypothetical protein ACMU_10210 [Actibacterium mucosum KCTC 23349]|uniref:Lipoprotein n=1 Tax=Actibacterium mucosum KCTC 23349 TaxID=1454373 RepID=A0A037ZI44_9RHOB|nr:hypothetical protein [Actibacterium mucosum]KAJ56120.1 hypothetical protein ACMU_10210 [Actibacterium mucosum KCTC 23349]